ncbi:MULTISPECIES: hypothetical protein [unclassified Mameliella]|uniref:hypothetical protein n=1 Tax=unclassified Mameliella TaxID=2630630 RepID=UPI00273D19E9|nr:MULTISPECIES: hypothetical protein [unclassified Mameliella]
MSKGTIISHDDAARRIEDALRLRVGRGKRYSFVALSDATGIATRTLESYVQGATPGLQNLLSLCSVLGPSFTSDVLAPCGQVARDGSPDDPQHMQVVGVMSHLTGKIADALADGHVDHREHAQMQPVAAALIEQLQPLARGRDT